MTDADRNGYLEFAKRTARLAGEATLPFFRSDTIVENKRSDGRFDPVTEADKAAETVIRDAIHRTYPGHGIFGEEFGFESAGDGLTWVIDPIDGTRAFMSGFLHWGVLLALFDGEEPIVGVLYQPYTGELFAGNGNRSTFERAGEQRVLRSSSCETLSDSVLATTGVDWFPDMEREQFERLRKQVQLCRIGGDCYLFAMAAMGYVHLATDASLQAYDIQALIPILRGAGAVITNYDGGNPAMGGTVLASANESLHRRALEALAG